MVDRSLIAYGASYCVRYMKYGDGFPAQQYLASLGTEYDRVAARFQASAQIMAVEGQLPTDTHGHWLRGDFSGLFEFKPFGHRIFAFAHGRYLYVVSGAKKAARKKQEGDYIAALNLRADYFKELKGEPPGIFEEWP